MKIGIYSGSFDPIHKGHTEIAKYVIEELKLDKLFFLPCSRSPFKKSKKLASDTDRANMISLVLPEKCELSDFELKRGGTTYTIETVKYFKNKFENDELFLLIGSDHLNMLHKWKEINEISKLSKIIIVRRNHNINKTNAKKYNAKILSNPIFNYSSTKFKKGYIDEADDKVIAYIGEKKLYAVEIVHNMLSAKRAKHSISCGNFAAELAKKNKINAKKAWLAGLFHDIAKEWEPKKSREFISSFDIDEKKYANHELHQVCGSLWLKHIYRINDPEIIRAVSVHTTLDDFTNNAINKLDKIIYLSDKICEGRKFEGIQKIRSLAFENLDEAFKLVVKRTYEFELSKGTKLTKKQEEIYTKIIN